MYDEVIKLIQRNYSGSDKYGDAAETKPMERTVFAKLVSIGTKEFYQAQVPGMKPEVKFILADYLDYQDEVFLKHTKSNGEEKLYKVIRTYRNGNELEITCERGVEA